MLAATASADVTPAPGPVLQGHGGAPPSRGVLGPLEVRTIVFADSDERAAIITVDMIGIALERTERLRKEIEFRCAIPARSIMICCSHTHCAPASIKALGMPINPGFEQAVDRAIVETTVDAAGRLEPVTLGLGCGSAQFNICRRPLPGSAEMTANYGGIVDRRVRILRVDRADDDKPMATLFHFACHPTTKSGHDAMISPDYPGFARSYIEQNLGGHALFIPGCFGNVRPAILRPGGKFGSATDQELRDCSEQLGRAVCRAARYTRTLDAAGIASKLLDIQLTFGKTKPADELQKIAASDPSKNPNQILIPWAGKVLDLIRRDALPPSEPTQMQFMRIGPLTTVTIPGEAVMEIGHAIEKLLAGSVDADDIWPIAYTNDMVGYLCTVRHYLEGGYEPSAYPYFDRPAPFAGEEASIVAAAETLASRSR